MVLSVIVDESSVLWEIKTCYRNLGFASVSIQVFISHKTSLSSTITYIDNAEVNFVLVPLATTTNFAVPRSGPPARHHLFERVLFGEVFSRCDHDDRPFSR